MNWWVLDHEDWVISVARGRKPRGSRRSDHWGATSRTRGYAAVRKCRAVVRVRYTKWHNMGIRGGADLVAYIKRGGIERDTRQSSKEFGTCQLKSFCGPLKNEKRIYHVVISPDESSNLNLKDYVGMVMVKVARFSGLYGEGQVLDWAAKIHTNTAQPHIHVLIHGVDALGNPTYLRRAHIANLRQIAAATQNLLTGYTNIPLEVHKERIRAKEDVPMPRVGGVSLDRWIIHQCEGKSWVDALETLPAIRRQALHARLVYRQTVGLLELDSEGIICNRTQEVREYPDKVRLSLLLAGTAGLKFTELAAVRIASDGTPPSEGLITAVLSNPAGIGEYAIFESFKKKAVVMKIPAGQEPEYLRWHQDLTLVQLHGRDVKPRRDNARKKSRQIGATGPLADFVEVAYGENNQPKPEAWQNWKAVTPPFSASSRLKTIMDRNLSASATNRTLQPSHPDIQY